jgi:hypothetical protein
MVALHSHQPFLFHTIASTLAAAALLFLAPNKAPDEPVAISRLRIGSVVELTSGEKGVVVGDDGAEDGHTYLLRHMRPFQGSEVKAVLKVGGLAVGDYATEKSSKREGKILKIYRKPAPQKGVGEEEAPLAAALQLGDGPAPSILEVELKDLERSRELVQWVSFYGEWKELVLPKAEEAALAAVGSAEHACLVRVDGEGLVLALCLEQQLLQPAAAVGGGAAVPAPSSSAGGDCVRSDVLEIIEGTAYFKVTAPWALPQRCIALSLGQWVRGGLLDEKGRVNRLKVRQATEKFLNSKT